MTWPRAVVCGVLVLACLRPQEPAPATPAAPATLALLVGIAKYAPPAHGEGFADLEGPENDVARARRVLVERFGFDPAGIVTLTGPQATHAAIVRTFHEHLIGKALPHTKVVFWFSGHGSRIPDPSRKDLAPREEGEAPWDDTLVAWDSRAVSPVGSHDLTDDELASLLAALRAKDVVVVTDCCHSGGLLRGGRQPSVREAEHGTAPLDRALVRAFWPADVPLLDDDEHGDLPHVVQIAGCGAEEQAGEHRTEAGVFGTLTWFLTQALGDVAPDASWDEVAAIVRARVSGHGTRPGQRVQVLGNTGRAVFGGRGRAVAAGYQVDRYGVRGLEVAAGRIHGLAEDAELRLVDLEGKEVGTAKVRRARTATSIADWQGDGRPPDQPLRAQPRTLGSGKPPLRVFVEPGIDATLLRGCEVAMVEARREDATHVLRAAGDGLVLCDGTGVVARRTRTDAADLALQLRREHLYRSLWEGIVEPGRFRLAVRIEELSPDERAKSTRPAASVRQLAREDAGFAAAVVGAPVLGKSTGGALAKIVVRNLGDTALHIAIVSATEDREVNVVFGRDAQNQCEPGGEITKVVLLGPGAGWPADKAMLDRYVVVATPGYADFKSFESDATPTRGTVATEGMPPFLREAMGGAAVRGPQEAAAWGIAICDVHVCTPELFAKTK